MSTHQLQIIQARLGETNARLDRVLAVLDRVAAGLERLASAMEEVAVVDIANAERVEIDETEVPAAVPGPVRRTLDSPAFDDVPPAGDPTLYGGKR